MIVAFQKENEIKLAPLSQPKEEENLWAKFQLGDKNAFAQIYESYIQAIYNYGKKITDDEALIEDCIQGLFLDMWKSRENLSVPTSIRFYLYASIKRRILKEVNKKKDSLTDDPVKMEAMVKESACSIEEQLINNHDRVQQRAELKKGLRQLSCNQRKAIFLKYYKNLSFQEISIAMDMSLDNIYKLVSRGLVGLKGNVKNLNVQ